MAEEKVMRTRRIRADYGEVTEAQYADLAARMSATEKELERVNLRLDRVDRRMDKLDEKIERVNDKLDALRTEMQNGFKELRGDIKASANHGNIMTASVVGIALAVIYSILK